MEELKKQRIEYFKKILEQSKKEFKERAILQKQKEASRQKETIENTETVLKMLPIDLFRSMFQCKNSYERHFIEHGRFQFRVPEECRYKFDIAEFWGMLNEKAIKRQIESNQGLKVKFYYEGWCDDEEKSIIISLHPSFFFKGASDGFFSRMFGHI